MDIHTDIHTDMHTDLQEELPRLLPFFVIQYSFVALVIQTGGQMVSRKKFKTYLFCRDGLVVGNNGKWKK